MHGCLLLSHVPDTFGGLSSLQHLDLTATQLRSLPESFGDLRSLQQLDLTATQLRGLSTSFGSLSSLELLDLIDCVEFESLPDRFGQLFIFSSCAWVAALSSRVFQMNLAT